jgi:hypothetical protein
MISRRLWISAPWMVERPRMILKPLSSGGLWLPVIIDAAVQVEWKGAK